MENSGASGVTSPIVDVAENAGSMVEIKIKTLDSETYTLRVDKCVPVPQLKEQIAIVTGVVSEQQRLICRGKVLKDDELLSAYHVEDGHTLHMVIRQPHQTSTFTGRMGSESATRNPDNSSSSGTSGNRGSRTLVFETVNIGQGDVPSQHIAQIISSILNAVTTPGTASNVARTDQRDGGVSASSGAPSSEPISQQVPLQSTGSMGPQQPNVIPDSLTTINQYLSFMRNEFSREGFGAIGLEHRNNGECRQSAQNGLPNPSSLAAILLSTRELLTQQAGGYISQFAGRLDDHVTVTDPGTRTELQNNVQRTGMLLQYLGSLLLELGRTTMTLSLGQTPSEAVINAGPAVYISGSGPNQIMVQPVPFYPGSSFGISRSGSLSSHGLQSDAFGSAFLPANIGIRLRTGRSAPGPTANQDEQIGSQQLQEQTDATRNISGANNPFQAFPDGSSFAGTSGVRVVPLRTVVAVPAGVARAPSDPAGTSVGFIYPVISRVQVSNGSRNDANANLASTETNEHARNTTQQTDNPSQARQNFETNSQGVTYTIPPVSVEYLSSDGSVRHQGAPRDFNSISSQQGETNINPASNIAELLASSLRSVFPGAEVQVEDSGHHEFSGVSAASQDGNMQSEGTEAGTEAVFFSNMVRQLMPFISQAPTVQDGSSADLGSTSQAEQQNSNDASSSRHRRDPPEDPSSKRQKREDC